MMIASALFVFAVALELFLFLGKDALLKTRRRDALEASLRQTYADLKEARQRIEARRAALLAAVADAERQRGEIAEADKAFAQAQKTTPTLVHTLGEHGAGVRFRAAISKHLEATAEPSMKLVWGCQNFIDVWASDIDAASALAAAQFPAKHDYAVGEFAAMTEGQPPAAHEHAA